ncbi:MAG: hypothetical protein ACRETZ_03055 [Steroidobacteraceae bacterium]
MSRNTFRRGVLLAITTPFDADGDIDHRSLWQRSRERVAGACA